MTFYYNEEQQHFLNGRVCLFIWHTIAINVPRSSSHFYKLPEKIPKFSNQKKIPKIVKFKPKQSFVPPCHRV